jgi:hypothetical protein
VIDAHKRKVISDEQVDTVAAVGQANERGHALMVADDVGLGKSREIAASAIDWLEKGKAKRILITSKGEVNLRDLESEMKVVAGTDNLPFKYIYLRDYKEAAERAQNTKPYNPVPKTDNTVYVVESFNLTPYRRAIQDLGIDGVLGDEVHTYKNDDAGVGQTWKVLHADWLQRKVPIAYFTATPGTTLDDLEYLYGLKEWPLDGFSDWVARKTGHGTEETQKKRGTVPGQTQDLAQQVGSDSADVSKTGRVTRVAQSLAAAKLTGDRAMIAHWERELKQAEKDQKNKKWGQSKGDSFHVTVSTAEMEQIMRELKMKGKYGARDLWRSGVEFAEKEAPLTQAESDSYRQSVNYMREVEKAFNAFANENEAMRRGFGITAFLQSAAKRRLFDVRLTRAMKEAKESLARGEQPVISVINVNETKVGEGYMAAALNQINVNKVLVDKETGEVTDLGEIPEAVAVKNDLIERAEQEFPPSPDPIAMIQKEFGKDKVSVITGNESPKVRRQMMEDFQQGIRKIAVISGAGKTGISLHHVTETPGGAKGRRHLILADYEWSATNFKQELGRVDRSGQASAPKITALTLGSAAEKKFISTIANRMKTLGAVSKGAAESTGTGALEHFELGGDIDNQVVRDMWRTLPLGLREQFRGKQFMNYDKDGVARPKSAIEGVGVRDFLLQLQLIPVEEGNQIWDHFWKQREETYSGDAVATREAQKTGKTKGEILRVHQLGPDLDLYEIKDSSGHRAGILSGMVTEHMNALQSHLESGEEKTAEGMTVIRKRREYTSFTGSNGEQISGLRLRPGQIEPIAKAFGKGIAYEHTPETALQDVVAGDKVPLDNGWTLYMGKGGERKGYVVIDGAKLSNTNRGQDVLRHGAKYNAVSGGFFYLPEDKEAVKQFLDRFPIKKQVATAPYIKNPTRIVPGSKSAYSDNETGLGEMQQLTDSIAKSSPGASLSSRIRIGSNLGEKAAGAKDEVTSLLGRLKGGFAALADAVKRPPKAGDYEKATGEWSGADQRSALDLYRFTKAIKAAVPEKLTREAISNWIEASGDEDLLRERAGKSDKEFKPGYEAALKLTDAEKTIAQNIMNLHDATLQESIKAGILEAGVENYIQHVYADKPKFAARIRAEMNFNTLVTKPSFSKKRSLPTYFDAEQLGFTPKDKDVGFLTSVHERSLREALAARAYIESLMGGEASDGRPLVATSWASAKEIGEEQPAYVIKPNIKAGEEFADYKSIDHPALRGWKWAGNVDGKNVFVQGDALVHPEIHQKLKNNLSTSALRRYQITIGDKTVRPGAFALDTAAEIKSFVLSFSVFHQTTLGIHALEHKVWPRHMPKLDLNDPVQSGLVDHGLMVAHYDAMEAFGEGLSSGGLVTKTPGIGPLYRTYVDYLFRDYMPRLKMQMAKVALERNRKRYPELSEDQLQFLTASQANAAFGGLNYRLLGRNKTLQDTLRLFLMAPDFTEARARFVAQAGTKYGREQLVALMLGAAVLYTAARIINEMSDKDPHWDKPFSVVHDGKEYHLRTVQGDVMDAATDPKTFLQNRVSPPVSAVFKNEDPHFHKKHESLADKLKSHGEGAVPIPLQPWMRQSKDSNAEKAMDSLLKMIGINEKKEQKKH